MKLPFTLEEFLEVLKKYNSFFYPLQALFLVLAGYIIFHLIKQKSGRVITTIIGVLWVWMGVAYHLAFFAGINKAAYIFGPLFILQGILVFIYGFVKKPSFSFDKAFPGAASVFLIVYALVVYPLIGYLSGRGYPYSPTFGLPCPTTIFTIAIFLTANQRLPLYIILIPLLWSVIGFTASFTFGIYEDVTHLIAGLVFGIYYFIKPKAWLVQNHYI